MDKYKISADEFEKVSFANLPTHPNKYGERGMSAAELKERFDAQGRLFRAKLNNLVQLIQGIAQGDESLADYIETGIAEGMTLKKLFEDIISENGAFASYLSVGDTTLLKKLAQLEELVRPVLTPRGTYDETAHYTKLDVVEYDGSSYIVLKDVTGVTPTVGDSYMLLVGQTGVGESANEMGGEIFNTYEDDDSGENIRTKNIALSPASTAHGNGTTAGCMAFRLLGSRDIETDAGVVGVYLLDSIGGIEVGDEFSIKYKSNYDCCGKVIAIGPDGASSLGYILADNEIAVEGNVINDPNYVPEEHDAPVLWFYHKPTIGTTPWGTGQHASGDNNKAVGPQSSTEGRDNVSAGRYAHTEGKGNFAVYAAHAQGRNTKALAECSDTAGFGTEATGYAAHAGGNKTKAVGSQSYAGGWGTTALGDNSFVTGEGTVATGRNQFVAGSYNAERDDAVAIFGNGTKNHPSNAFVVLKDGTVEFCIRDESAANNVVVVKPDIVGKCLISATNTGEIRKFGINLIAPTNSFEKGGVVCSVNSDKSGIVLNGTATASNWGTSFSFYTNYYPTGHYTFFVEGLSEAHASSNVYVILKGINEASTEVELARVSASTPVVEFDMSEPMTQCKMGIVIKAGETFDNELVKFQLQAGTKTEFEPRKTPKTIQTVAGEDAVIAVDDLEPFTLISQTEGNVITCRYPVRVKSYIDKQIKSYVEAMIAGEEAGI